MNIEPRNLDRDSERLLVGRVAIGDQCIMAAGSADRTPIHEQDRETYAQDAIVDVLTTLFGAAGHCEPHPDDVATLHLDEDAAQEARAFLDRCYRAWEGDAEDYCKSER